MTRASKCLGWLGCPLPSSLRLHKDALTCSSDRASICPSSQKWFSVGGAWKRKPGQSGRSWGAKVSSPALRETRLDSVLVMRVWTGKCSASAGP